MFWVLFSFDNPVLALKSADAVNMKTKCMRTAEKNYYASGFSFGILPSSFSTLSCKPTPQRHFLSFSLFLFPLPCISRFPSTTHRAPHSSQTPHTYSSSSILFRQQTNEVISSGRQFTDIQLNVLFNRRPIQWMKKQAKEKKNTVQKRIAYRQLPADPQPLVHTLAVTRLETEPSCTND